MINRLLLAVLLATTSTGIAGCSSSDDLGTRYSVSGKVTFSGSPVSEGEISFVDKSTGGSDAATLASDGSFQVSLPAGSFAVVITPPTIMVDEEENTEPYESFKDVPNIPEKYRTSNETPIAISINADSSDNSFDMVP
ncbi:MAG: carboxypeptidase-like regulatory domain-containing protein [Planctomycetaceae bacterium]